MNSPFRRPAPLFPSRQEAIPGEPDPAETSELAHRSAEALLNGVRKSEDPETVERVVTLAREEGLADLATLWSHSPADSLPGALWRLYVLHTWTHHDPEDVARRYEEGSATIPGLRFLAGVADPPRVEAVRATLDEILRGAFTGDLALALGRAGAVATLAAHGTARLADAAAGTEHAEELTRQAGQLLSTGEDLARAARAEEAGELT